MLRGVSQSHMTHWAIVDCNVVEDDVASQYPTWLDAGIHILSCNLSASSGPQSLYDAIQVRGSDAHHSIDVPALRSCSPPCCVHTFVTSSHPPVQSLSLSVELGVHA